MTDLVETVRIAHACYLEQEAHPFDAGTTAAVLCDLVHLMLERDATAPCGAVLDNVRYWMISDATQMTDDELRLRIAFDRADVRRSAVARADVDRARSSREEAEAGIKRLRAELKDDELSPHERRRMKARLKKLKLARDASGPALSSFDLEAQRRGIAFHVESSGGEAG